MVNYPFFNDKSPLLKQLPDGFKSAAFILNPFEKMPDGWESSKKRIQMNGIIQMMKNYFV
nr:DUF2711 family protein [Sutcliffiella rhizosphaerae]